MDLFLSDSIMNCYLMTGFGLLGDFIHVTFWCKISMKIILFLINPGRKLGYPYLTPMLSIDGV